MDMTGRRPPAWPAGKFPHILCLMRSPADRPQRWAAVRLGAPRLRRRIGTLDAEGRSRPWRGGRGPVVAVSPLPSCREPFVRSTGVLRPEW